MLPTPECNEFLISGEKNFNSLRIEILSCSKVAGVLKIVDSSRININRTNYYSSSFKFIRDRSFKRENDKLNSNCQKIALEASKNLEFL